MKQLNMLALGEPAIAWVGFVRQTQLRLGFLGILAFRTLPGRVFATSSLSPENIQIGVFKYSAFPVMKRQRVKAFLALSQTSNATDVWPASVQQEGGGICDAARRRGGVGPAPAGHLSWASIDRMSRWKSRVPYHQRPCVESCPRFSPKFREAPMFPNRKAGRKGGRRDALRAPRDLRNEPGGMEVQPVISRANP